MDIYKRLKLEFPGINTTIRESASKGNITNHLSRLELALNNDDLDVVRYCLEQINEWYNREIGEINKNEYCFNKEDHNRNKALITEYKAGMEAYELPKVNDITRQFRIDTLLFLSHSSTDTKYGDAIEKLICGLGVRNDQLVYTSHPLHKIPLNDNIFDYLRRCFDKCAHMIFLWSNEYLDSPACLNEMGAAWIIQSDYTHMFVPTFNFSNPKFRECAVDTIKLGAVLNGDARCKANMIEFKNKLLELFGLSIGEQEWTYLLDNFIQEITGVSGHE